MTSSGSCRKDTDQCKSPFPSTDTVVSLFRAKTVQQRPLLPREVKTRLPDCGVAHQVRVDHLSRLPVTPPSTYKLTLPKLTKGDRPHGVSQFRSAVDCANIQRGRRLDEITDVADGLLASTTAIPPRGIETTQRQTSIHVTENCNVTQLTYTLQLRAPVHLLKYTIHIAIGIGEFNVPLDALQVNSQTIFLASRMVLTTDKLQPKKSKQTYAKLNLNKLKPGPGRLLHRPARKQIEPILHLLGHTTHIT